jgi:hypothetical protein
VPNLPPPLIEMAWKMLAKEPSERPTMAQVADTLRRLLWMSGEAVTVDGKVQEGGFYGESGRMFVESGRVFADASVRAQMEASRVSPSANQPVAEPLAPTVSAPSARSGPIAQADLMAKPGKLHALVADAIATPTAPTVPPTPARAVDKTQESSGSARLAEAATLVHISPPATKSPSHSGAPTNPALSSPIWEPMEIVKTDYNSSPGVSLRSLQTPTPKPVPAPSPAPPVVRPSEWLWWALLALAIVLSLLLARVLPR